MNKYGTCCFGKLYRIGFAILLHLLRVYSFILSPTTKKENSEIAIEKNILRPCFTKVLLLIFFFKIQL